MKAPAILRRAAGKPCGHCRKRATWLILWADGRATWKACDTHKGLAYRTIRANGKWAAIVWCRRIPSKGAR